MYLTEGTDIVVNSIAGGVWGSEDELTGALIDEDKSWDWLYLYILPMYLPVTNSRTNNIKR